MSNPISSVQQHLLDLVNARLQTSLTAEQVDFAPVAMLDATVLDFTVAGKRNSSVGITTKPNAEPAVDLSINYNRLQLQKLFSLRSKQFDDGSETTTVQLLEKLSTRAGITLTVDDIVDTAIDRTGDAPYTFTIQAKPTSYQVFGQLEVIVGEGSTGPVDPEPEPDGAGFFMSNMAARALTSDFTAYQAIPDELAPVFGTNYNWTKTEAAIGDQHGRLWAFLGKDKYTTLHRSLTGGRNWTQDELRATEGNQPNYPDYTFTGRMLAYHKGSVYGYFIHNKTQILWVCRLREEEETGDLFDLQPILAMRSAYMPAIASDGEYICLTSREPDPDRLSYEDTTYLHWSTDANTWNKVRLFHPWSTNDSIMPMPEVQVHAMQIRDGVICGVGKAQWADKTQMDGTDEVYFELDLHSTENTPEFRPIHYWPTWQTDYPNAQEPSTSEFKQMAVIGDNVLIYVDNTAVFDPSEGLFPRSGIVAVRETGQLSSATRIAMADSGIIQGRIYDNGTRVVISGMRASEGANREFLAYTDDRLNLTGWEYGTGDEELFADVDTSQYATYVSATASNAGEIEQPIIPNLTPIQDVRWTLPGPADNIDLNATQVAANAQQFGIQSTGKIIVAGTFGWVQGQASRRYLFRLLSEKTAGGGVTSAIDTTFASVFGANQTTLYGIDSMVVADDDSIILAGQIPQVGGVTFYNYARVPANGGAPAIWPQAELYDQFSSRTVNNGKLFKTPDGKIFLFALGLRKVGVNDAMHIAKFNADGSVDGSWNNPFNPGGSHTGSDVRSMVMLPNGDLLVNRGYDDGYQPLLVKGDGTVPASQPFAPNDNCAIWGAWACPYTNGVILHSGNTRLATDPGFDLGGTARVKADWSEDFDWNGRIASDQLGVVMEGSMVDLVPLSDGTGFMIGKQQAYWNDENGSHFGHERDVFCTDKNGKLVQERLPLWVNSPISIIADPNNTGDAAQDSYFIGGQFVRVNFGEYPRSTIVLQQNYVRTRVVEAVEEEIPQS